MEDLVKIVNDCIEMDSNLLYKDYKETPPLLDIPDDIDNTIDSDVKPQNVKLDV